MTSPISRCSAPIAPASSASASACSAASVSAARAAMQSKRAISPRWALAALCLVSWATSGCYLGHLARGQMRLLCARVPIEELLHDPSTSAELRAQFERVAEVRAFARELGLAVGDRYTEYAPWPGDFVVTTV